MDWKTILLIVLTALLVFVWLPSIFLSVRRFWRECKKHQNKTRI